MGLSYTPRNVGLECDKNISLLFYIRQNFFGLSNVFLKTLSTDVKIVSVVLLISPTTTDVQALKACLWLIRKRSKGFIKVNISIFYQNLL